MEIEVTPIRKNQGLGKVGERDASVVIGGSKPDILDEKDVKQANKAIKQANKGVKRLKSPKTPKNVADRVPKEAIWQPSGNQVETRRKPTVRQRVTFTPNKHTKQLMKEIEAKYGSNGKSEFINVAIEAEYNRRK
jgi:hypothetical protein